MLPVDGAPDSDLGCFASRKFRIKPMGKRGSAVTCGSSPRRRPYGVDTAFISHQLKCRLAYVDHEDRPTAERCRTPPERCRAPPGRTGTRHSLRPSALDPGFHGVPAGPIHPDRAADGAGVTGVRYGARAATARPASRLLDGACAYHGARARCGAQADRRPFGSPTVLSSRAAQPCCPTVPSDRAIRRLRPCHPRVLVSCGRGFRRVLG